MRNTSKLLSADSGRVWQRMPARLIPSTLPLPDEFTAAAQLSTRVLDVGCGIGSAVREVPRESFAAWIGVDINPTAIAVARQGVQPNVRFLVHDARQPLPDMGTFDLFLFKGVLTCLPTHQEQLRVLQQAAKHAAKRRLFVVVDLLQNWDRLVYRRRYECGLRAGLEKGTFLAPDGNGLLRGYLAHHFEYPDLIRLFREAGLWVVSCRDVLVRTRTGNEARGFVLIAE